MLSEGQQEQKKGKKEVISLVGKKKTLRRMELSSSAQVAKKPPPHRWLEARGCADGRNHSILDSGSPEFPAKVFVSW